MAKSKLTDGSLALEQKQLKVITIEAADKPQNVKLRVAAYVRVSSASDDQLNSFSAQNKYYTSLISQKENWTMVDIYADEGITGTSVEKREDFKRMIADCRKGKIDRILVKSISRFARNTKECLETIRVLKALGVNIHFEKENIDTGTMSGEMMTALFASFAQAESQSISGNMRWSYQKRMESGKFITCKAPFGYRLINGTLEIEESEAEIIRWLFNQYLSGFSVMDIAKMLTLLGTPTRDGTPYWQNSTVMYMLQNEKYVGNSLLQKYYSTNTLPIKIRRNSGEKNQYFIEGSHTAIIDKETFDRVQSLYKHKGIRYTGIPRQHYTFSKMLQCPDCGKDLGRRVGRGIPYWVCRNKNSGVSTCSLSQITEKSIEDAFCRLYYKLKHNGKHILSATILSTLQSIRSRRMLWSIDVIELNKRISELTSQNQLLTTLKQQGLVDPDIFISQSNALTEQLRAAKLEKERLLDTEHDEAISTTRELIKIIESGPDFLDDFDEELFGELIDRIMVESNERLRFRLKNGLELTETIERTVR